MHPVDYVSSIRSGGCKPCNSPKAKDSSSDHRKTSRNYPPLRDKVLFNVRHDSRVTWLNLLAVSRGNEGRKQTLGPLDVKKCTLSADFLVGFKIVIPTNKCAQTPQTNQQMHKNKQTHHKHTHSPPLSIFCWCTIRALLLTHTLDTFSASSTHTCSCSLAPPVNSVSGCLMSLHLLKDMHTCECMPVKRCEGAAESIPSWLWNVGALRAKVKPGMSLITVWASSKHRGGEARQNGDVTEGVNKGLNLDLKLCRGYYRSLQALARWHQLQTGVQNKWCRLLLTIKNVFLQTTWPWRPPSLSACMISPKCLCAFFVDLLKFHFTSKATITGFTHADLFSWCT